MGNELNKEIKERQGKRKGEGENKKLSTLMRGKLSAASRRLASISSSPSFFSRKKNQRKLRARHGSQPDSFEKLISSGSVVSEIVGAPEWLEAKFKKAEETKERNPALLRNAFADLFFQLSEEVHLTTSGRKTERKNVTKPVFMAVCKNIFGADVDTTLCSKLFDFMDCDRNGVVDEVEFSIVSCFLLEGNSGLSNAEITYQLFDSDRDGGINQAEFSELLAAVVGNTIDEVMKVPRVMMELQNFVNQAMASESLEFYQEMERYFEIGNEIEEMPVIRAEQIVKKFIDEGSDNVVNVSGEVRGAVIEAVQEAKECREVAVPLTVFRECFDDVRYLFESDVLPQFKRHLRYKPYSVITIALWERFELNETDLLKFDQFQLWAEETPGLFDFLKKMQDEFSELIKSLQLRKDLNL